MTLPRLIWWIAYFIFAIWMQKIMPGLDAMAPGLLICLQDRRPSQTIFFLLFCIVVQEGAGTLPFGASIVWYTFVACCYYIGSGFFVAGNISFIITISVGLGLGRLLMFFAMGSLQATPLDSKGLVFQCLAQVAATPVIWFIATFVRPEAVKNANRA